MSNEIPYAILLVGSVLLSFRLSNWVHHKTGNFVISRKIAHFSAGVCILFMPLVFDDILFPVLLPSLFLLLLLATHKSEMFHGFARRGRLAELWFPFSVLVCMAVAWQTDPWLAVAAALFLSWGDGCTGLLRWLHHRGQAGFKKYWCGTWGMLVACLIVAIMVSPYWVGVLGAVVATIVERWEGLDDNLTSPLAALAVMLPLVKIFG